MCKTINESWFLSILHVRNLLILKQIVTHTNTKLYSHTHTHSQIHTIWYMYVSSFLFLSLFLFRFYSGNGRWKTKTNKHCFSNPLNRRPNYAVSNWDILQNFNSTRHNTPSVSLPNRIKPNSTLAVLSGLVDCPIRQALLRCYCSVDLKTRLSPYAVSNWGYLCAEVYEEASFVSCVCIFWFGSQNIVCQHVELKYFCTHENIFNSIRHDTTSV